MIEIGEGRPRPPRGDGERHRGISVRDSANHSRSSLDLTYDAVQRVVCLDPGSVIAKKNVVAERVVDALPDLAGNSLELHGLQLIGHQTRACPKT